MIAFDLDGVFVSDFKYMKESDLEHLQFVKFNMLGPIFNPKGIDWAIITGREAHRRQATERWLEINRIRPNALFHDKPEEMAKWEYKTQVLNAHPQIQTFIESSEKQTKMIADAVTTGCKVIHFSQLITNAISLYCK